MRVVSLLPSATEIVYALGVEPVATSHECDHPPEAAEKPAANRSLVDPDASPESINEQVVRAERAGGVYEIDLDVLERADPDLIISQGVCDVCAVDSVLVEKAVAELNLDCKVLTTDPHSLTDVFDDIERVGRALDREARAREVRAELEARVEAVTARTPDDGNRPRTAVLDWIDPVMVAGHWIPGMIEMLGARYGLEESGGRSRPREWTEIREYDPEILVVAPCGFGLDQTLDHIEDLTSRPGYENLTAVRNGRAFVLDGHHYINRPGPRLTDTMEHLAGLLYPERFDEPPADVARPVPGTGTRRDATADD